MHRTEKLVKRNTRIRDKTGPVRALRLLARDRQTVARDKPRISEHFSAYVRERARAFPIQSVPEYVSMFAELVSGEIFMLSKVSLERMAPPCASKSVLLLDLYV